MRICDAGIRLRVRLEGVRRTDGGREDSRRDYRERRFIAVGVLGGRTSPSSTPIAVPMGGTWCAGLSRREGAVGVKGKPSRGRRLPQPSRGRVDWDKFLNMTDEEIERTSPPELRNLPDDFWTTLSLSSQSSRRRSRFALTRTSWTGSGGPDRAISRGSTRSCART